VVLPVPGGPQNTASERARSQHQGQRAAGQVDDLPHHVGSFIGRSLSARRPRGASAGKPERKRFGAARSFGHGCCYLPIIGRRRVRANVCRRP